MDSFVLLADEYHAWHQAGGEGDGKGRRLPQEGT